MKINFVSPEYSMIEYTLSEIKNLAGVDCSDSELAEDIKITQWLGEQSYRVVDYNPHTYSSQLEKAVKDHVEILIIKEN
jgi:predicted CoA-binding protein